MPLHCAAFGCVDRARIDAFGQVLHCEPRVPPRIGTGGGADCGCSLEAKELPEEAMLGVAAIGIALDIGY